MTKGLTADAIMAVDDLRPRMFPCPAWGGNVYIRIMTAAEREAYEATAYKFDDERGTVERVLNGMRPRLLVKTLCNENGERLFDDSQEHILASKSGQVISYLFGCAMIVNGMRAEDQEAAEKNSGADPAGASSSS